MKKVLVVDDTKNIRNLLTTCLELKGCEVVEANNGPAALELFQKEHFDLAFLDIKLPKLSGTEVLRRIRSENIKTPVVIMTAFATVKNAVECTKLGAVAYLQKPFSAEKVNLTLEELQKSITNNSPKDFKHYISIAEKNILEENLDLAYNNLRKALALNPSFAKTYELLGIIYEKRNELGKANKFYSIAKQL